MLEQAQNYIISRCKYGGTGNRTFISGSVVAFYRDEDILELYCNENEAFEVLDKLKEILSQDLVNMEAHRYCLFKPDGSMVRRYQWPSFYKT